MKTKPLLAYLAILAVSLLTSGILVTRSICTDTTVILILNYLCKFLTLVIGLTGLGLAISAAARRQGAPAAAALAVSTGGYALVQVIAAICTAADYIEYDFDVTLWIMLGAALANTLLQLALYAAVFLFAYLLILRRRREYAAPKLFARRNPYTHANLISVSLLFIYQLAELIHETVAFVEDYAPNIYPTEIATIIFDFVFLAVTMAFGYVLLYAVELFCHERISQA